jgi:hypothetical protein
VSFLFPSPIRIILIYFCRHADDLRNGDDPEANQGGVMYKDRDIASSQQFGIDTRAEQQLQQ